MQETGKGGWWEGGRGKGEGGLCKGATYHTSQQQVASETRICVSQLTRCPQDKMAVKTEISAHSSIITANSLIRPL